MVRFRLILMMQCDAQDHKNVISTPLQFCAYSWLSLVDLLLFFVFDGLRFSLPSYQQHEVM